MEKSAINTVYVVTVETMYKNGCRINVVHKCFYREDEAKAFVENAQKISDKTRTPYILWESWDYVETTIE